MLVDWASLYMSQFSSAIFVELWPDSDSFFPTLREREMEGWNIIKIRDWQEPEWALTCPPAIFYSEPTQSLSAGRQTYKHTHLRPPHPLAIMWHLQRWNGPFLFNHSASTPPCPQNYFAINTSNCCHTDKSAHTDVADIQRGSEQHRVFFKVCTLW